MSGVLDLAAAAGDLRCVRADASLETRETVDVRSKRGEGMGPEGLEAAEAAGEALVLPKVWAETTEHTAGTLRTHFSLATPLEAPPTFRTARVALRWVLRFEFWAAPADGDGTRDGNRDRNRDRGDAMKVEWTMPVEMASAAPRASAHGTAAAARERARRAANRAGGGTGDEGVGEEGDGRGMVRESSLFAIA